MKKNLGVSPAVFPMPVLMIGTYGENEKVDVMNVAWGGICSRNMVAINISAGHKTTENIRSRGAFTVALADEKNEVEADFFGIASGNTMDDKFERTGMHATKSGFVDAPIIDEFPVTLECKVVEMQNQPYGLRVLGEILNVSAEENVLDEEGKIDVSKVKPILFDQFKAGYYKTGEKIGQAFSDGKKLM